MKQQCELRFFAELNDFLAPHRRGSSVLHRFSGTPSIKDQIEALGVPHTEVGLLLVDGRPVGFDHLLKGGEHVVVHPVRAGEAHEGAQLLRPGGPARPSFLADVHLGRLASYLRLLGFDCLYRNDLDDPEAISLATSQGRILLTRDTGLLKRAALVHGAYVHATDPVLQLREVFDRFALRGRTRPFTRCARCNGVVVPWHPSDPAVLSEPAARHRNALSRCTECFQLYWPGTHPERLRRRFAGVGIPF